MSTSLTFLKPNAYLACDLWYLHYIFLHMPFINFSIFLLFIIGALREIPYNFGGQFH